jgi:thiosulfate dehydrogenase (quinone) large subunit
MIVHFLRTNVIAAAVLAIIRIYLGWSWLSAGWGKLTGDEPFNAGGFLMNAINNPVAKGEVLVYPTYVSFLENFAVPNAGLFSILVSWGEFLVGLGLLLGALTPWAAFFAVVMNFAFMFAGTISTNPWMILLTIPILIAGYNAGRFGLDRWIFPFFKSKIQKE